MLLIINNSNRNQEIKEFVLEQEKKLELASVLNGKKIKTSKCSKGKFPLYVTDKLLKLLRNHNIPYINILSLEDLLNVIEQKIKITGIIIGGSELRLSTGKVPKRLLLPCELALKHFKHLPIYGICFGFQMINQYFGGKIDKLLEYVKADKYVSFCRLKSLYDGKNINNAKNIDNGKNKPKSKSNTKIVVTQNIFKNNNGIYKFLHGDCLESLGKDLVVTAKSNDGIIYAIKHKKLPIYGSQFHPELSGEIGENILTNFFGLCGY